MILHNFLLISAMNDIFQELYSAGLSLSYLCLLKGLAFNCFIFLYRKIPIYIIILVEYSFRDTNVMPNLSC